MSANVLERYLDEMSQKGASDLFLTVGSPPSFRVEGHVIFKDEPDLTETDLNAILEDILDDEQKDEFKSTFELNIAIVSGKNIRFRVSIFRQKHHSGMVIRMIKSVIPTFTELGLPDIYKKLVMEKRGLILLVGATGSGKSTSLASMLEYRNDYGSGHIITVEDPIEFIHEKKKCIFTQREIGIDTYSYGIALKNALRQSPDVVVIGEIRDRETLENAMLFCETGHLVLATLHANNSNQAIERMVNLFPEEMHNQVLATFAVNIKAIASQRLVEDVDDKQVLAYEVMINEGLIKVLIEEGKIKELKDVMAKNRDLGMITFDQSLLELLKSGRISEEIAVKEADNANNVRLRISQASVGGANKKEVLLENHDDDHNKDF